MISTVREIHVKWRNVEEARTTLAKYLTEHPEVMARLLTQSIEERQYWIDNEIEHNLATILIEENSVLFRDIIRDYVCQVKPHLNKEVWGPTIGRINLTAEYSDGSTTA